MTSGAEPYDLAIIGTVGLPASYGGFETLAEQLTLHLSAKAKILVFCSGKRFPSQASRAQSFNSADLTYVDWDANGWQSMPYDFISLWQAARQSRVVLVLGVSGCLLLPLIRFCWPRARIVTNIDGVEWKRQKWGRVARMILRASEWAAVRFSHEVIADNQGICDHIARHYAGTSHLIAYGGDQAAPSGSPAKDTASDTRFEPASYFLSVCRIEPENHVAEILEAFAKQPEARLTFVGNWAGSGYGTALRDRFGGYANIEIKDPIYDQARLKTLRTQARGYIHGHSAGGTNPSLVEAMCAGMPILAFDVDYNRYTTEDQAIYWSDAQSLAARLVETSTKSLCATGDSMAQIARREYTWPVIAGRYEATLFQRANLD